MDQTNEEFLAECNFDIADEQMTQECMQMAESSWTEDWNSEEDKIWDRIEIGNDYMLLKD